MIAWGTALWFIFLLWIIVWLSDKPAVLSLFNVSANSVWDAFGILNSLISIVTLILLWETYKTQKLELKETSNALKEQQKLMDESKFHEYFLFLMQHKNFLKENITKRNTHWKNIDHIHSESETRIIKGEDVFRYWASEIKDSKLHWSNIGRDQYCRNCILEWFNDNKEYITSYTNFIKIIEDEILLQNNWRYKNLFETIQSYNEKYVIDYINTNIILANNEI